MAPLPWRTGFASWATALLLLAATVSALHLNIHPGNGTLTSFGNKPQSKESNGDLDVTDVAFGVLTCGKFLKTRLRAQRRTWLQHVQQVLVLSDEGTAGEPEGQRADFIALQSRPNANEAMTDSSRRALPLVKRLYERFPHAKWYFFVDDDTYVYVSTLLARVLGPRDPAKPHYVGWGLMAGPGLFFSGEWRPRVAIGGAGFGISAALMRQLAPRVPDCEAAYSGSRPGDLRVAECISDLGIDVEDDLHLYPETPSTELTFYKGHLKASPPASFHHLTPEEMYRLYSGQFAWVEATGDAPAVDFAEFALKELLYRDSTFGLDFVIRFGLEVNVSVLNGSETPLVESLRVAKVCDFRAAPPGQRHLFEQEYFGGSCPTAPGRNASVVLALRCGGSGCARFTAGAEPSRLVVCGAEAVGLCGFRLQVAIDRCTGSTHPLAHD